jgi:hypothetical protein
VPAVRDGNKVRIEGRAQSLNRVGQRIAQIFVFALAEAVTRHDDVGAEAALILVERGDLRALLGGQQRPRDSAAAGLEFAADPRPVERRHTVMQRFGYDRHRASIHDHQLSRNRQQAFPSALSALLVQGVA